VINKVVNVFNKIYVSKEVERLETWSM